VTDLPGRFVRFGVIGKERRGAPEKSHSHNLAGLSTGLDRNDRVAAAARRL